MVYLSEVSAREAWGRFQEMLGLLGLDGPLPGVEEVTVEDAIGRALARPVRARACSPGYHAAAMDGAAVKASDTAGASEANPVRLRVPEQAVYVNTGDPLPDGFDAVIMLEDIQPLGDGGIEITGAAFPWQHVRLTGEDVLKGEMMLVTGDVVRPVDVGFLISGGVYEVPVRARPSVALIPTGDEIVEPGSPLRPGLIPESNTRVQAALLKEWGALPVRWGVVPDRPEAIREALASAAREHHLVVINAGSSAGSKDHTARVLAEAGTLLVHGVSLRPGKPLVIGFLMGKPVIGIPGYPVSSYIDFQLFVRPLIRLWLGLPDSRPETVEARFTRKTPSPMGIEEYLRVRLGHVNGSFLATPLARGAGATSSLSRADGIVAIPPMQQELARGETVEVELLRPRAAIQGAFIAAGGHDPSLEVMSDLLGRCRSGVRLCHWPLGSTGGIEAVRRGEAHMAGINLLDEATGVYNLPHAERALKGRRPVVVKLVRRLQGLMVRKGNPHGIQGIPDLARAGMRLINRGRGTGTRALLDHELRRHGIQPEELTGYRREARSHLAAASAVASGAADVAMGTLWAARVFELDFIPVAEEDYDLVIPRESYESPGVARVLEMVRSNEFRREMCQYPGYDLSATGEEIGLDV